MFNCPDSLAKKVLSSLTRWEKDQHKLTVQLLAGVSSVEEALDVIASVLDEHEMEYKEDDSGCLNVAYGSTTLTIEIFSDTQLGLMVEFRAILAENVDPSKIPAEMGIELLALNWDDPLGAIAFNAATGTMWYTYSIQLPMLTEEVAFSCMSYIANIADSLDDELSELLPTRSRRRLGKN